MKSLACSSTWLAITLSKDALITALSSGAEQLMGYSVQELIGRPITQILADSSAFDLTRILDTTKEWGGWNGEIIHRSRGGESLEARCKVSLLAGNGNRAAGYLLISDFDKFSGLDDCERPALAEVSGNLRAFAHDLNNPLAVLMGFTQLLILNTNCQGKIRNDVEKIYAELKRVIQVVEKLHRYAFSLYEKSQPDSIRHVAGRTA